MRLLAKPFAYIARRNYDVGKLDANLLVCVLAAGMIEVFGFRTPVVIFKLWRKHARSKKNQSNLS